MSETIKILRNSKRSVDSVDAERSVSVDMQHTVSPLGDKDIQATIDLNEQYLKERNACNDYRLIVTIKPYCTNVLFNACTEAVINEGSNDTDVVLPYDDIDQSTLVKIKNKIKGKDNNVGIYDMIRNTEYSREGIGFDYHPGLDIFNNHILRNKTYRIVNDYIKADNRDNFNTISDYMRSSDGSILKRCCRRSIDDVSMVEKHLYDKDDILPFYTGDAVKENLREQDGWFGFYNTSVIPAKNKGGVDMDISRVINSKGNCEFIDMYPDRTLFSFIPKYNPYRNRLEYNWDYAITYAFDSTTQYYVHDSNNKHEARDFELIKDGNVNALATLTVEYRTLPNGRGAVFFRSAVKHNLNVNDKVYIYFDENEDGADWHKSCNTYLVAGVGDINHKEQDYYFYVTDLTILEEIFCTPYLCDINPGQVNHTYGAWNYVRDYFYAEYDSDQIPNFDENKKTKVNQLVSYGGNRYIATQEHTGAWDSNHFEIFDPTTYDNYVVEYPDEVEIDGKFEGGLTNIPSENDWFIKVKDVGESSKYFILFNHDRDIQFDGSVSSELFIQAIINNAFTNKDEFPDTNPADSNINTNTQVNPAMNGLWSDYISIRFAKTNGMYDCSYYVRKFKQVPDPNIVFGETIVCTDASNTPHGVKWINPQTMEVIDATQTNVGVDASVDTLNKLYLVPRITEDGTPEYSQYITVQSLVKRNNGEAIDYRWERRAMTLDNETYQLTFSKTIYGDNISQTTFTDDLNVMGLKDNLGRNLSEVFLTIVKSNRGYKKWYNHYDNDNDGIDEEGENPVDTDTSVYNDPDIEYSHCFGPVTCGFDISKELDDSANIIEARAELMDVTMINPGLNVSTIPNDEQYDGFSTKDIEVADNWFYGDIVEYCPWTCEETTLSDVCFRFNTAQREFSLDESGEPIFKFDEISRDDYDNEGFKVCTYGVSGVAHRDEGYYYKAHYRIPLKALGPIIQSSHPYISVVEASPIQVDGMYILVRTALRHNLNNESKVLLRDTTVSGGKEWWLDVVYIVDDYSFVINIIPRTDPNYRDWIEICQYLNNRQYTLRVKNPDIPERASRLGVNTFLWRNTADILDISSLDSDINNYVFANNAIYIDTSFNFYLKRQDPYKVNGLYYDGTKAVIKPDSTSSSSQNCEGLNSIDKWFLADVESKADRFESRYEYNDTEYEAQC